jgi:hypothetical protein
VNLYSKMHLYTSVCGAWWNLYKDLYLGRGSTRLTDNGTFVVCLTRMHVSIKSSTNHLFIRFSKYQATKFFMLVQPILPRRRGSAQGRDADADHVILTRPSEVGDDASSRGVTCGGKSEV